MRSDSLFCGECQVCVRRHFHHRASGQRAVMLSVNLQESENRLEVLVTQEPDRSTWTETVLSIAVHIQGMGQKGLECLIDISSLGSLSAYSKERIFALRDLFLRQGFTKVTFHVATAGEAMRMNHKRRAEVLSGIEAYLAAPLTTASAG